MTVVGVLQSQGARDTQEDAFGIIPGTEVAPGDDLLMLMADGMGGHAGGEIAASLLVNSFAHYCIEEATQPRPRERMRAALEAANDALRQRKEEAPDLAEMGSTLVSGLKLGTRLVWLSVGDSLIYLFRDGKLARLNADHSVHGELMELVRAGKMTRQEADSHPRRNALRSAVIGDPIPLVDCSAIELHSGDLILLASDGLDTLTEDDITEILSGAATEEPRTICALLLNAVEAAQRPRQDNTTIVCYRYQPMQAGRRPESLFATLTEEPAPVDRSGLQRMALLAGLCVVVLALLVYVVGFGGDPALSEPEAVTEAEPAPTASAPEGGSSTIASEPDGTAAEDDDSDPADPPAPDLSPQAEDEPAEATADTPEAEGDDTPEDAGPADQEPSSTQPAPEQEVRRNLPFDPDCSAPSQAICAPAAVRS